MRHDTSEWSVSAGRLRHDHRSFETRFADLRRRASEVGWTPLVALWTGFDADVTRHLAFEELSVFPGFARHKPGEGDLIRRLVDEHEQLRRFLDVLGVRIENGDPTRLALEGFASAMSSHEENENTRIDPWLELQDRRHDPGGHAVR